MIVDHPSGAATIALYDGASIEIDVDLEEDIADDAVTRRCVCVTMIDDDARVVHTEIGDPRVEYDLSDMDDWDRWIQPFMSPDQAEAVAGALLAAAKAGRDGMRRFLPDPSWE